MKKLAEKKKTFFFSFRNSQIVKMFYVGGNYAIRNRKNFPLPSESNEKVDFMTCVRTYAIKYFI